LQLIKPTDLKFGMIYRRHGGITPFSIGWKIFLYSKMEEFHRDLITISFIGDDGQLCRGCLHVGTDLEVLAAPSRVALIEAGIQKLPSVR